MDNYTYNSLTSRLIQNGIIDEEETSAPEEINFFETNKTVEEPIKTEQEVKSKKRLNRIEYNNIQNIKDDKKDTNTKNYSKKEKFLIKFFPKLYKAYLAKNALKELVQLDIDAKELLDKTIPYGEEESRYKNLIKYLKYANDVQVKITNKFN